MLEIKQDTKFNSIINHVCINKKLEIFLIAIAPIWMYIYNQSLILFFLPIFYFSFSIWNYRSHYRDLVTEFHKQLMIYKNWYTQDEIIYYDHIKSIEIWDHTMWNYVNPYIVIYIKEGLEFKYNNRKKISLFGYVNYKEIFEEINYRIIK
jgi:hypothetical protein